MEPRRLRRVALGVRPASCSRRGEVCVGDGSIAAGLAWTADGRICSFLLISPRTAAGLVDLAKTAFAVPLSISFLQLRDARDQFDLLKPCCQSSLSL